MWSISEIKSRGKEAFKANYWRSVLVSFILAIVAGGSAATLKVTQGDDASASAAAAGLTQEELAAIGLIVLSGMLIAIVIGFLIKIFIENPLQVGCYKFFKENVQRGDAEVGVILEGFGGYGHTFCTLFLKDLFLVLWTCLLVVPGIIKSYSYRMVPYIIKDNPELSATEVITKSREMMNGHKWRSFLLDLSFIGWIILGAITCGIVFIFWTAPYIDNTNAALYLELSEQ